MKNEKLTIKKKFHSYQLIFCLFILFFVQLTSVFAQLTENKITSVSWENNSLEVNTTLKISYAEARLKNPDRLVIDILNCSLGDTKAEKNYRSQFGESISITEPTPGQVRIIFVGQGLINRKSYLTNNDRTLIVKVARINTENNEGTVVENEEQTPLEKFKPGRFKEIVVKEEDNETYITIGATRSIKYNTFLLKNPDRFAIDLLNILPPLGPLPKFNSTLLVSGVRIGRAASGVEATRIVVDLAQENIASDISSNLLGNKLEIKFKINEEKNKNKEKSGLKVVIDPGHGGYDTGASYGGFEEKYINLVISEKLKKNLETSGITVFLTRDDDGFLSLAERVEITNVIKPSVFISIHGNALVTSKNIRGLETYYWSPQSQRLAYYIHKNILSHLNVPDHFIRKAKFYVIRHTSSPAVLAELGFLSNRDDRQLLTNATTQDQYAKALAQAILKFLDIEPKAEDKDQKTEDREPKPEAKKE